MGRYEQALALVAAPRDAYWRALLRGRFGDAWYAQNRFGDAAEAYRLSIAAHAALPALEGEDAVGDQRANLALAYLADGTVRCAEREAATVMSALDARAATRYHPTRAAMLGVLAGVALQQERAAEAESIHERQLALLRALGSPKSSADGLVVSEEMGYALRAAADTALVLGRPDAAEARLLEARRIAGRLFSTPHALQADVLLGLARVRAARGDLAGAMREAEAALALLERAPPDALRRGDAQLTRGDLLLAAGRTAEALPAWQGARAAWRESWPDEGHPRFLGLLPELAAALRSLDAPADEVAEAEAAARAGRSALQQREAACLR